MQGNERGEINEMEEQPMTVVVDQARRKPAICNLHLLVICTTTVHTTLYLHRLCSEVRERGEHRVSKRDKSVVPLLRRSICCWWAGRVALLHFIVQRDSNYGPEGLLLFFPALFGRQSR